MSLLLLLLICEPAPAQTKLPVPKIPATAQPGKLPPAPPPSPTQTTLPDDAESQEEEETPVKPASGGLSENGELKDDPNPLNPVGDNLDRLIQLKMSDDTWKLMLGDLTCLEATDACIKQLQVRAIETSTTLKAIDQRIEVITQKVDEAKKNNQATVRLGIFEPLVQSFLKVDEVPVSGQPARKRGFLDKLLGVLSVSGINDVLSLIGVPLFRNVTGGDAAAQSRSIAIGDLQVKLAEIENKRGDLAEKIREQVIISVLDFDIMRRNFQISQEIAKRSVTKMKLIEVGYRFGESDTESYLNQLNGLDAKKAETFRTWARMRSQMARIKLLVLGAGEE
ncbi:MAG: hypothetical protein LH702_12095 [Phormidesmis sp. CAN_BIN44]|nr:hypothetical protein [Phormidesmis sp. CAN_BIN44]